MSKSGVIRYLEAEAANYPGGVPLRVVAPKSRNVSGLKKRAIFLLDVDHTLDKDFWSSFVGEGLRKIVVGGLGLTLDQVDFRTAEQVLAPIDSSEVDLVLKFGAGDVNCPGGKLIVAPGLLDVLGNVDSKRRLWNEIKRVWR